MNNKNNEKIKINWVGLLVLRGRKVLMVREEDKDFFVLPGGAIEEGEMAEEALRRELKEELGVEPTNYKLFKEYDLPGKAEGEVIHFVVFRGELKGDLETCGDIEEINWIDNKYAEKGLNVGNLAQFGVFPDLKKLGLIN